MLLMGIALAGAAGCETCRQSTVSCSPRKIHTTSCPALPDAPATNPTPTKPVSLPPTIKEVRGEEVEPRQFASIPTATTTTSYSAGFIPPPAPLPATTPAPPVASQGDVLLIPRWVYVPYTPHTPNGPSKLPANIAGPQAASPYVQTENGMTVLPPMGGPANAQQAAMMDQFVQQMKEMNQRMAELESKNAVKPTAATPASVTTPTPAFLPPPAPPEFLPPPAPTPNATPTAPAVMLPLPPPVSVPMIPPAM
jgi:hypothetical protein